jgi:hypothetical protein
MQQHSMRDNKKSRENNRALALANNCMGLSGGLNNRIPHIIVFNFNGNGQKLIFLNVKSFA